MKKGSWYRHYKNHKLYKITAFGKIQENDEWVDAVMYTDTSEKGLFCRSVEEFKQKFTRVHNIVADHKR